MRALLFAVSVMVAQPLLAQQPPSPSARSDAAEPAAKSPLKAGEGRQVAAALAEKLKADFVYPQQADAYAAMLEKNAAAGRYDSGTRGELVKLLTDDLQAVHKDGHLHVMLAPPPQPGGDERGGRRGPPPGIGPLIQSAKTIAPGIGYIRFTAFMGTDEEVSAVRKWLADNADDKVLIFDLRNHHGGGIEEQDAIFSYIFAKQTPLVKMALSKKLYDERRSPLEASRTLVFASDGNAMVATHSALPGPATALRHAKIYLLTSNRTASAADHFSLALKSSGRATLIGETTAGANHFGGPERLTDNFGVWMPVGRTYDIKTGKDWEGVGVQPDIAVDPKLALVVALEKAGLSKEEAIRLDAGEVPSEPVHREKTAAR
ncbi:MAG: S41 family peptidase [Sphingomonas sp.]|nr:S41 family peptidase [Sphingomonas sp.]